MFVFLKITEELSGVAYGGYFAVLRGLFVVLFIV